MDTEPSAEAATTHQHIQASAPAISSLLAAVAEEEVGTGTAHEENSISHSTDIEGDKATTTPAQQHTSQPGEAVPIGSTAEVENTTPSQSQRNRRRRSENSLNNSSISDQFNPTSLSSPSSNPKISTANTALYPSFPPSSSSSTTVLPRSRTSASSTATGGRSKRRTSSSSAATSIRPGPSVTFAEYNLGSSSSATPTTTPGSFSPALSGAGAFGITGASGGAGARAVLPRRRVAPTTAVPVAPVLGTVNSDPSVLTTSGSQSTSQLAEGSAEGERQARSPTRIGRASSTGDLLDIGKSKREFAPLYPNLDETSTVQSTNTTPRNPAKSKSLPYPQNDTILAPHAIHPSQHPQPQPDSHPLINKMSAGSLSASATGSSSIDATSPSSPSYFGLQHASSRSNKGLSYSTAPTSLATTAASTPATGLGLIPGMGLGSDDPLGEAASPEIVKDPTQADALAAAGAEDSAGAGGAGSEVTITAGASKMARAAKNAKGKGRAFGNVAGVGEGGDGAGGEDEAEHPLSEKALAKRGYKSHILFNHVFHLEDRWTNLRELGQGAYGLVISAQDNLSGETIAIKLLTRVFDKVILARRCLRELTLLRHLNGHENVTGLIDMDVVVEDDFNEIYLFMEPMEADLHQIIRSGQQLTNAHICYFLYQLLRGMKYIHSSNVIHRDLKPGNLLVNADCELKICDFGLSRGFRPDPAEWDPNSMPEGGAMTEYVATRWYRAPEIMLSYKRYSTAIDVWSIGCILAELLGGKPLFKGKDYIDQLNLILKTLGSPDEASLTKVGSEKACQYIRSLPTTEKIPFANLFPKADPLAVDLLEQMLTFDPSDRITVAEALLHPYLAAYHDETDEPDCPVSFDKWEEVESVQSLSDFKVAIRKEIDEFRKEVRTVDDSWDGSESASMASGSMPQSIQEPATPDNGHANADATPVRSRPTSQINAERNQMGTPQMLSAALSTVSEESATERRPARSRRSSSTHSHLGGDPFVRRPVSLFGGLGMGFTGMTPMDGSATLPRAGHMSRNSMSSGGELESARNKSRQGSSSSQIRPLMRTLSALSVTGLDIPTHPVGTDPPPMSVSASDAPPSSAPRTFGAHSRRGTPSATPSAQ